MRRVNKKEVAMMKRRRAISMVAVVAALMCGCADSDSTSDPANLEAEGEDTEPDETEDGITEETVDGVWIFSHNPHAGDDATHTGVVKIEEECLIVDDAVVVWHATHLTEARDLVARVKAGEAPSLEIGGGGMSMDEGGESLPEIILERCPTTRAVWFESGE